MYAEGTPAGDRRHGAPDRALALPPSYDPGAFTLAERPASVPAEAGLASV